MRKRTKWTLAAVGLCCASACGAFATGNALTASGESDTPLLVTELFAPSGIVVEPMVQDENMELLDKGLLLTSSNVKDTLAWQDECAGEFSFSYLPTKTGEMYDAKRLEIAFTDSVDGDSFTIVVEHGATMNAYVRFENVSAGVYYMNKKQLDFTSFCNENGAYTQFSAKKVGVRFDPSTMCVYAGDAEGSLSLVWDLSKEINDGRDVDKTFDPFASYTVSFAMPAFSLRSGSVILYEVNGCLLSDLFVKGSGAPSVFADVAENALVSQAYALPEGKAYDVLDEAVNVTSAVYDADGKLIAENAETFTPTAAGEYTLSYTATNSFGKTTVQEYVLTAYESAPAYDYEIDWTLNDEYVLNEEVYIPELWLFGGLRRFGKQLGTVTVEKDGSVFEDYENKDSGFAFAFAQTGEYAFIYEANGEELRYEVLINGAENRFVTAGLQNYYEKNSIVDCNDFQVLIGGEEKAFDFTVKFPSGKRYVNKKFQTSEAGKYLLKATATADGKTYSFEKSFTVLENYADYFLALHGAEVSNGISSYTRQEGVVVTTTHSGALVEYTQPIDVSRYVDQRTLTYDANGGITSIKLKEDAIPLIQLTVDPDTINVRSAAEVYIYLTDAADPNNKITINARYRMDYAAITTGANDQSLKGFTNLAATNSDVTTYIDGQYGSIRAYGSQGFRVWHTFDGEPNRDVVTGASVISLYYDNEARQLLSYPGTDGGNGDAKNHVIMDYDDSRYLQSDLPWNGFTSNEVYLSLAVSGLTGAEATACIYTIDGKKLGGERADGEPTIRVSESELFGLQGYSLAIPQATATDRYGNAVQTVAKIYYEKNGKLFDVSQTGGRFDTAQSGTYRIVYTAIDAYGRRAEKTIHVTVAETYAQFTAAWEDSTAEYTEGKIADEITLYGVENATCSGAIGKVETVCKVYYGGSEVEQEDESFVPQRAGTYLVEYTLTDAVGRSVRLTYEIEIAVPTTPVITSSLPTYVGFVRGNTYAIADVYFIDYTQADATEQKADAYIDGKKLTGAAHTVEDRTEGKDEAEQTEILRLEYRYGDVVLKAYDIPVKTVNKKVDKKIGAQTVEVTKFLAERYFLTDENTVVTAQKTYFTLTSYDKDSYMAFAQPLQANGLDFVMDIDQTKASDLTPVETNLRAVKVRITDASDEEKTLLVEIQTDELSNKARLCINGEDYSAAFTGSLVGAAVELIKIRYNDGYFYDGNSDGLKLVAPSHYENGEPFEGFSGAVYVSFAIEAIDEAELATVRLYSINGQQLISDMETDVISPELTVKNEFGGIYEQGTTLSLSAAEAYDALSSIVAESLTLSVTYTQNGNVYYAKDADGLTLNGVTARVGYTLPLSETGAYRVLYTVEDCRGNVATKTFAFEVARHQDPVITLQGELPTSVKAGSSVDVPWLKARFTEENESNLTWVVVVSPSTNTYTLLREDDGSFVATELGDYVVRYCALDVYGSYTIVEYTVTSYK